MVNVIIRIASVQLISALAAGNTAFVDYETSFDYDFMFTAPSDMTVECLNAVINLRKRFGMDVSAYEACLATAPSDAEVYSAECFTEVPALPPTPSLVKEEEVVVEEVSEDTNEYDDEPRVGVKSILSGLVIAVAITTVAVVPMLGIFSGIVQGGGTINNSIVR